MSGQWEVVQNKKKDKTKNNVKTVNNQNNKNNTNIKIEEILPKSQIKNIFNQKPMKNNNNNNNNNNNSNDSNKEKKKGQKDEVAGKKPKKKIVEKSQENQKFKTPKSLESAFNMIDVNKFQLLNDKINSQFPDAPIVCLKELTQFLNQKLSVDIKDPIFSMKSYDYPLKIVPTSLLNIIKKSVEDAGESNMKLFFDISLTTMATDMSKGLPSIGYKIFLQFIAQNYPNIILGSLAKHQVLRNSYQNRANIGLSILWALGQGGYKDFNIGLKIYQDIMLPLIEYANYSKFIYKYLLTLLTIHDKINLTKEQFSFILENILNNDRKNYPNDVRQELIKQIPKLNEIVKLDKSDNFIDYFIKLLNNQNNDKTYQYCDVIVDYLKKNEKSLDRWNKIYSKNIESSGILLTYIETKWDTINKQIHHKLLKNILENFSIINKQLLLKKKKDPSVIRTTKLINNIQAKMAVKKEKSYKPLLLLFIIVLTTGAIYFDINQQGSWEKSNINKTMKKLGVCDFVNKLYEKFTLGLQYIDGKIEEQYPKYKEIIYEFSEPYIELFQNLLIIFINIMKKGIQIIIENYPTFKEYAKAKLPGLIEFCQQTLNNIYEFICYCINFCIVYLKEKVFDGQLSTENIRRLVNEMVNTTQTKAVEYYHWLYQKVQTAIK